MKILIYLLPVFLLLSCQQDTGIIIPAEKPSLVVNSILCADSLFRFNLTYSQSITNNSAPLNESNAFIEIFDKDTNSLEILLNQGNGNYLSALLVAKKYQKYIVKITTPRQIYWSGDSIPSNPIGIITGVDSINFRNNPFFLQIHYSLSDQQIGQNFYGFKMKHYFEEYSMNDTLLKEEWLDIETIEQILTEDLNSRFSKKHLLFTDKYFNNSSVILNIGTSKITNTNFSKTKKIILYTEQFSSKAYEYFSSLNEHIFYQNDPFSQPISIKGNISNAFGAFTGVNIKADTLDFKF